MTADEAIEHEFVAYYLINELPSHWDDATVAALAAASEQRLRRLAPAEELRAALLAASDDAQHTVIRGINRVSELDWTEEEWWPRLQRVMRAIAARL